MSFLKHIDCVGLRFRCPNTWTYFLPKPCTHVKINTKTEAYKIHTHVYITTNTYEMPLTLAHTHTHTHTHCITTLTHTQNLDSQILHLQKHTNSNLYTSSHILL